MRGTLFPFTRGRLSTAVLLVTTSSACLDGCAERAGLVSARGYAERGELREAYREYHQAYLESDDPRDREARDRLGVEISDLLARQALEKERAGDLPGSLAGYLHALEYDPAREDLIASLIGIEERLFRLAEVTREAGSRKGTWEAYRLWHDFRKQEPTPGVVWAMGEAAAAAADAEIAALTSEGTEVLTDARGGPEGSDLSLSL